MTASTTHTHIHLSYSFRAPEDYIHLKILGIFQLLTKRVILRKSINCIIAVSLYFLRVCCALESLLCPPSMISLSGENRIRLELMENYQQHSMTISACRLGPTEDELQEWLVEEGQRRMFFNFCGTTS